ncbi:unnamed protein product, partial [Mycena citricolor]
AYLPSEMPLDLALGPSQPFSRWHVFWIVSRLRCSRACLARTLVHLLSFHLFDHCSAVACVANENEKSLVSHLLPSTTRSRNCDTAYVVRLVYRTTCLRHALGRLPKC